MNRILTISAIAVAVVTLSACETPTTQRYAVSANNNQAIKSIGVTGVNVGAFVAPTDFSSNCRALGAMQVADNMTHTEYIRHAFEDELKIAGAYASTGARVTLTGKINKLEFSSSHHVTGGYWDIDLGLASTNGRSMTVSEHYEFDSGFAAPEACRNTAEAFSRAVQDLVGKAVMSPEFAPLVK
jgi:hypothetical protein